MPRRKLPVVYQSKKNNFSDKGEENEFLNYSSRIRLEIIMSMDKKDFNNLISRISFLKNQSHDETLEKLNLKYVLECNDPQINELLQKYNVRSKKKMTCEEVNEIEDKEKNRGTYDVVRERCKLLGIDLDKEIETDDSERLSKLMDLIRPKVWGECQEINLGAPHRPCPFYLCKNNLYIDRINDKGEIKTNFNDEPWTMKRTCSLYEATNSKYKPENLEESLGLVKERARQVLNKGVLKLRDVLKKEEELDE